MSRIREFFSSPHIQVSLAAGISILTLAWFSGRVLPEPIGYLPLAIPPFIATIFEAVKSKYKDARICTAWYWVAAIIAATALVIYLYWI